VKKLIYILLLMGSMGFTSGAANTSLSKGEKKRKIDRRYTNSGYLEVTTPTSYSLTVGS
jgi:hypothetical protein